MTMFPLAGLHKHTFPLRGPRRQEPKGWAVPSGLQTLLVPASQTIQYKCLLSTKNGILPRIF